MRVELKKYIEIIKDKFRGDYKKIIITIFIVVVIVVKIVFPGLERIIGNKHRLNLDSSNLSEHEDFRENDQDFDFNSNTNDENKNLLSKKDGSKEIKNITIYITGAVSNPGVITISSDKRLDDAIKMVGGLTKDADYERINLAMNIEDSQHYIIPYKGDKSNVVEMNTNDVKNDNKSIIKSNDNSYSKVNINQAEQSELEKIPGVGPSTAKKIIDYRTNTGKFSKIEDIKNVSGIGDKKFDAMKDSIDVK